MMRKKTSLWLVINILATAPLSELHPYEVPVIITIDADKVSLAYLNYANKGLL